MKLKTYNASCYCQSIQFTFKSKTPSPFLICYCSICRKLNGSGGFGINIMCEGEGFNVTKGKDLVKYFIAVKKDDPKEELKRQFCPNCGSHLWIESEHWPNKYPYASCVDSLLPKPPSLTSLMERYKREWVPDINIQEPFPEYPDENNWIVNWHKRFEKELEKEEERIEKMEKEQQK